MTTYSELVKKFSASLEKYDAQEAVNLVHWLLEHHLGLRRVDMMRFLEEKDLPERLLEDLERLKAGEPIQHILGKAPFYGRDFQVNSSTLIPRNETEELVHAIIKENKEEGLRILDIGTGSGCIPITLALEMNGPEVFAVDISEEALSLASKNAKGLHASITFLTCDILKQTPVLSGIDIVVSNPPYIPEREKIGMHTNVVNFEPDLALFVPNNDPIIFYREIARKSKVMLKSGGKIYFEIHEDYGGKIISLLEEMGYLEIKLRMDLNGKDRMVSARI